MEGLSSITRPWMEKIKASITHKEEQFGKQAEQCLQFFAGPYSKFLYDVKAGNNPYFTGGGNNVESSQVQPPFFRPTINKAAEVVSLFGPMLYPKNPVRTVTPRQVYMPPPEYFQNGNPDAQVLSLMIENLVKRQQLNDQIRGELWDRYLNYTPRENDLHSHSRKVIDEALITGAGAWINEIRVLPDGTRVAGSFYLPIKTLLVDPDAVVWPDDIQWMAVECTHPVWQVEDEYGWQRGTLKPNKTSRTNQSEQNSMSAENKRYGQTNDLLTYYKIWSKMGLGGRLKTNSGTSGNQQVTQLQDVWFGDNCFIVICEGCDYPLNMGPQVLNRGDENEIKRSFEWPIPYWIDDDWPIEVLEFHRKPNQLWPVSHLQPALGELIFINWAYSFVANKAWAVSRDMLVIAKSLAEEAKDCIKHGPTGSVIEVDTAMLTQSRNIDAFVKYLQHPAVNPEIYNVIDRMTELFDKRTGLTELMYGATSSQYRSAAEAEIKKDQVSVRPQDMAQIVEEKSSAIARKELMAARWVLEPEDVKPCLGVAGAFLWQELVQSYDPKMLFHQYECQVESGSGRRPDKDRNAQNMRDAMQVVQQPFFAYGQGTGNFKPFNTLISEWAKSIDMDPNGLMLDPLPPPMPSPPPGEPQPQGPPQ